MQPCAKDGSIRNMLFFHSCKNPGLVFKKPFSSLYSLVVCSPALTDGSIGDMLFFHSYKNPGLVLDMVEDIRGINDSAIRASPQKTGIIILGGGAQPPFHLPLSSLQL